MLKMMNGYLRNDWEQLNKELKDAFHHANSQVYMYTTSYLEWLCKDQRERGNFDLKTYILAYDNISRMMIDKGALAEYSQVEMLLGALQGNLGPNALMSLELDRRDPLTFKYDKLWKDGIGNCVTANAITLLASEVAHMAPGVSPYPVPAGVPLPQMPVVINLLAIISEQSPAPAQGTEEIPIANTDNTIDTKTDNTMKSFDAWTFQMSKANGYRYVGQSRLIGR